MSSSGVDIEETAPLIYVEAYRDDMAVEFLQQASSYYCYTQPVIADNDYHVDGHNMRLVTLPNPNMAAAYFNRSDLIVNTGQLSTQDVDYSQEIQKMYLVSMDEVTWSYIVFTLAVLPMLSYALVLMCMFISMFYARCRLHRKIEPSVLLGELPGVSIIKPLMGVDPFLETNLESHFLMNYPKFELLCCVQDEQDPAINLVQKLKDRYPKVDCRLFIGGKDGIVNPMVNNMAPAYDNAKYDIVWVSTSRIKASTDILLDMVAKLQSPKVALVHQLPFTTDQKGLAATIEKIYFGATVARNYLAFNVFGIPCFTGMSYLVKKPCVDELGGLSWFGKFLAEDFFLAKLLHERGYTQVVAAVPAQQNVNMTSIAAYKDRMVRWVRLRMNMMPLTTILLEPLAESVPLGIYISWSMHYIFAINPYVCFACHWTMWFILDLIQFKGIQKSSLPVSWFLYVLAWVIRELLYVLIYFEALINCRHITWGKRTYRLSNLGESVQIVSDKGVLPI